MWWTWQAMPMFDVGGEKQTLFMLPMQKSLWPEFLMIGPELDLIYLPCSIVFLPTIILPHPFFSYQCHCYLPLELGANMTMPHLDLIARKVVYKRNSTTGTSTFGRHFLHLYH
jgi:hypothetical protein